ncbi:MAG: hypothetical protein ACO26Y_04020 [Burkholderiaceae bacterium]|jgi:hypothetical protein
MDSKPKSLLEDWFPTRPIPWAIGFAALYLVLFLVQHLIGPTFSVIPDRIDIVFLPAFARVAAVLIAGLAGLAGIAVGSFVVSLMLFQEPIGTAFWFSCASATGIWLSYWIVRQAMGTKPLPFTLPMLMVLSVLYCAFNAVIHGLTWELLDVTDYVSTTDLALMMVGDLLGVLLMFGVVRLLLRRSTLIAKPLNQ